ncbi:MAG: hypothetical protein D6679_14460 [Candidatus Hydrogenedentota bacterium]|nr:MAG: hypothetical protein D6679_14460 [Candidatus Hydrogenedentota bacterium]
MRDDAAKLLLIILIASFALGLAVLGVRRFVLHTPYTTETNFESNKEAGFYPYNPPVRRADEPF